MAESVELQCETCRYEQVTKSASKWCTDCQEGFCVECCRSHKAQKISRSHYLITTEDYKKTEKLNVNLECEDHRKQLDFYCPTHDSVLCVVCVQLIHSSCKDLKPLDMAAQGAKTSTAFSDLEQNIDGLLDNIEKGVQYLQQHKTNLEEQEDVTRKSIATKRAEINKQLDRLEEKILKELKSKSEKAVKEISLMTTKLETQRKQISDLKENAQHMKQFSSNLQMFVGILSILKTVVNEINGIKLLINSIPQLSITVQFNPIFDTETFEALGEIQITSEKAVIPYVERRIIQAQHQRLDEPLVHNLYNIQLKLRTNIKISKENFNVTSCLILPNKSLMIASWNKPSLTLLKEGGTHDRDISVPNNPYDVTIIDDQRVAVSYGMDNKCISIVNINTRNTNLTLQNLCKHSIRGITYTDGKLYAVAYAEGIKVIGLDGAIIKTICIYNDARSTFKVTTQKDKIYYTVNNRCVHCIDMEGTEIWTCQDDRLMGTPAIAVDDYGIMFLVGRDKSLLLAISPDGKQKKVLLTDSNRLQIPNAVYYDKDSKRLLVCNQVNGHAALYDVIY